LIQCVHRPVPMSCALTADWLMLVEVIVFRAMPLQNG
jgi:hypothetical protein